MANNSIEKDRQKTERLGPERDQEDDASPLRDRDTSRQAAVGASEEPAATVESRETIPREEGGGGSGCDSELAREVERIALQRPKYSGAARRRYRRAREAEDASAAGKAGAIATAGQGRKPPGTTSGRGAKRGGGGQTTSEKREQFRKRQRESKETPPNDRRLAKKPREGGPWKASYAEVASDLPKLAIIHSGFNAEITKEQSELIQEGIMEIVDEIPVGDFTPRFQETYLNRGALKVVCADKQTAVWLGHGEEPTGGRKRRE